MKPMHQFIAYTFLCFIVTSCAPAAKHRSVYSPVYGDARQSLSGFDADGLFSDTDDLGGRYDKNKQEERKIIYNAFLTIKVKNVDTTNKSLEAIAKKHGGYVQESGTYQTVIRVKESGLKEATKEIGTLGKVERKSTSGEDVTNTYFDLKIRLENAEKARKRYLELLSRAESVEAALKVEKELERLNETIDLLKGKMNRINHLDAYATITVRLHKKEKLGVLGYVFVGLYEGVKWLFVRG